MTPILQTADLAIGYTHPQRVIREHLALTLHAGELVCLIGPNGAGKSTLLRTIAGMQAPLSGSVLLNGANLHRMSPRERARQLAVVLTGRVDPGLLTGYGLVALGRHPYTDWTGQLTPRDEQYILEAVAMVGGQQLAPRRFAQLSDGEQQKLLIARALAQEPAVMLLDEPTAYLDLPRRVEVLTLLRDLARRTGRVVLLSTHDLDLALRSADRIWLMPREGAILSGAPEDLVLDGSFAHAFESEGVRFDPHTGSFRTQTAVRGTIALHGSGLVYSWTVRALERKGYLLDASSPLSVHVEDAAWTLHDGEQSCRFASLHDLLAALDV